MADIKWIKLATCMPDDEKMKLIDAMPERDSIHYLWIRLLIQAARTNAEGEIFLSEDMPYTDEMLSILFSRPLESIKLALKTLSCLGMIEIDSDKVIRIVNWDKHQNIEGMERVREQNRKRAENHRERKKQEKKAAKSDAKESYESEVLEGSIIFDENEELEKTNNLGQKKNSEENYAPEENETLDKSEPLENLETSEEAYENTNVNDFTKNFSKITQNKSNVTHNESNVTVTQQNKKEIENKKKNKKEKKEIDKDKNEDINLKALELMQYHEKITGKVGGCDYVALRSAIDIHGEKRVKLAMDVGFEKNCPDIKYAIGVLKNWKRDGYPEEKKEVKTNGFRSFGKSNTADKNEFAGFKPKEPRKLTEAERKRIEANLI